MLGNESGRWVRSAFAELAPDDATCSTERGLETVLYTDVHYRGVSWEARRGGARNFTRRPRHELETCRVSHPPFGACSLAFDPLPNRHASSHPHWISAAFPTEIWFDVRQRSLARVRHPMIKWRHRLAISWQNDHSIFSTIITRCCGHEIVTSVHACRALTRSPAAYFENSRFRHHELLVAV